jgi:glycosyltransferase involved in cell wall biosynthesis
LQRSIEALRAQTLADWELVLVDLGAEAATRLAAAEAVEADSRIAFFSAQQPVSSAHAIGAVFAHASGQFTLVLHAGDVLDPEALAALAHALETSGASIAYADEDVRTEPFGEIRVARKPAWSPERLRCQDYLGRTVAFRAEDVRAAGGVRAEFGGAALHDLVLRLTEKSAPVHVERVLGHLAAPPEPPTDEDWEHARRAVSEHLERLAITATVSLGSVPGVLSVRRDLPAHVGVSLVIPTRGSRGLVFGENRYFIVEAVRSALALTEHENVEVVVVYDTQTPQAAMDELAAAAGDTPLVLVPYDAPFNFSAKCNLGVVASGGDVVVLFNDDLQAHSQGWLEQLAAPLLEPTVGMTGARLLYSDSTLQHAGHAYGAGHYRHPYLGYWHEDLGDDLDLVVNREASGVTAACAAITRALYDEVGGLSELLPINFNDVDLCAKVTQAGRRILWLNEVTLFHFEHRTRAPEVRDAEIELINARWGLDQQERDPYLPNYELAGRIK